MQEGHQASAAADPFVEILHAVDRPDLLAQAAGKGIDRQSLAHIRTGLAVDSDRHRWRLRKQGLTIPEIANALAVSERTVFRYLT